MRELYINNALADIDEDYNPTFQFRSFLFARMQGYEAARTWETSIPLTARNRAIIGQSQQADSASVFPYTTHTVSAYDNGYPIVEGGRAYLIGVGGGRATFVFVLGETLQVLKSLGEKKIRTLTETAGDLLSWNPSMNFNDMSTGFGWCNYYSFTNQDRTLTGSNADIPFSTLHPVVTLDYIMNKIQAFFGLTFIGFGTLLSGCAFPLKDSDGVTIIFTDVEMSLPINGVGLTNKISFLTYNGIVKNPAAVDPDIMINPAAFTISNPTIRVFGSVYADDEYTLSILKNGVEIDVASSVHIGDAYLYTFETNVEMTAPDVITLEFSDTTVLSTLYTTVVKVRDLTRISQASYMGKFPIIPNLPDMTCADFINQCCMLTGLFPFVNPATPTTVSFYSAKILTDNAPTAQNWSKYLIKTTDTMGESEDMTHSLDGFAQNNRMLYAADPTNQLATGGNLTVANTNIEQEAELFRLAFAAARRASQTNGVIDYPLYDVRIVDGLLVRNPIQQSLNVLGKIVNVSGINYLTFPDELKFSALQASTAYLYYQAAIYQPHIVKEKFILTARLASLIDVLKPVYLEQYGKYYAILEAQVDGDYNADVTLLEV